MPKISIIMPSLNVVDYIDECVMSAINQTIHDLEIICVDAGSTDGTLSKLRNYEKQTYEGVTIKVIESPQKSYGYQVNLGLEFATGKYVAILETDDYVDSHMYEELFDLAEKYDLDFVKADFDTVVTLKNGFVRSQTIHMFGSDSLLYNIVQDFSDNPYVYANDYNIWKGIYRKSFLDENNIRFNESKGAAFQDIGFSEQVHACAKRGYYTDCSFYRYRCDRDEASVKSNKGLMYSFTEFKRLMETPELWKKITYKPGFYWHMAQSFHGEFCKVIELENYNLDSDCIKPYLNWFIEHIKKAMDQGMFPSEKINVTLYKDFVDLVTDYKAFTKELYERNCQKKKHDLEIYRQMKGKRVIIFGAGIRGQHYIQLLQNRDVNIEGVCDNNSSLWGNMCCGIPVLSPEEAVCIYKQNDNVSFLIASRYYCDEIKKQLINSGVREEDIII